jgi:hypothetical protein
MPITHATIPVPPDKVGQTEWAEAHTLPTPGEIGAITTASALTLLDGYLTAASASLIYLLSQDASTTYARQASAVTTAQLGVYLLSQDASTTYARQASAVTTAQLAPYLTQASADSQLSVYLLSQDASTTYARQASAVTTAQLATYLLAQDASTTYARQASAVTTAQLGVYLLSQDASTTYARQASAVTTAQLAIYLLSNDASTTYARQVSAVTTAQLNNVSAGVLTSGTVALARLGSAGITSTTTFLRGDNTWAEPPAAGSGLTQASADARYGVMYLLATDLTSNSNSTIVTLASMIVSVSASTAYEIKGTFVCRTSTNTTGIGIMCSVTPTPGVFSFGIAFHGFAAEGGGGGFQGYAIANGDEIVVTSCNAAAIDLPIALDGTIVTGTAGQIQFGFRSEVSGAPIVLRRGSSVRVTRLGAI